MIVNITILCVISLGAMAMGTVRTMYCCGPNARSPTLCSPAPYYLKQSPMHYLPWTQYPITFIPSLFALSNGTKEAMP